MNGLFIAFVCFLVVLFFVASFSVRRIIVSFKQYKSHFDQSIQIGLQDYFIALDTHVFLFMACAFSLLVALLLNFVLHWLMSVFIGIICLFLPFWLLKMIRKRRNQRFDELLGDFLLTVGSTLQAGVSIQYALRQLSLNAQYPLNIELNLLSNEQRLGVSFDESLNHLYQRVPTSACALFISALKMAFHTGGQLSETLYKISSLLMKTQQIHSKIRALSAQGKIQAWIMGFLPLFCLLGLQVIDPSSGDVFFHTLTGMGVLLGVMVWEFLGILFILKLIHIEV